MEATMQKCVSAAALALLLMIPVGTALAANEPAPAPTISSLPNGVLPISDYYNQSVYDPKDNKIGDINDLLLDKEGKVSAIILGVGGFLGAGEKNVAVPFNALKLTEKNGKRYLVMDTTKEALNRAPGYTFDRTKKEWIPAKQG
jgi:sporulation protein YlmC with PRC-barrel domain